MEIVVTRPGTSPEKVFACICKPSTKVYLLLPLAPGSTPAMQSHCTPRPHKNSPHPRPFASLSFARGRRSGRNTASQKTKNTAPAKCARLLGVLPCLSPATFGCIIIYGRQTKTPRHANTNEHTVCIGRNMDACIVCPATSLSVGCRGAKQYVSRSSSRRAGREKTTIN